MAMVWPPRNGDYILGPYGPYRDPDDFGLPYPGMYMGLSCLSNWSSVVANEALVVVPRRRRHRIPTAFQIDVNHRFDPRNRRHGHEYMDYPPDDYHHRGYRRQRYGGRDRSTATDDTFGSSQYDNRGLYHDGGYRPHRVF